MNRNSHFHQRRRNHHYGHDVGGGNGQTQANDHGSNGGKQDGQDSRAAAGGHDEPRDLEPQAREGERTHDQAGGSQKYRHREHVFSAFNHGLDNLHRRQPFASVLAEEAGEHRRPESPEGRVLGRLVPDSQ